MRHSRCQNNHPRKVLQSIRDRFGLDDNDPQKTYLRGLSERLSNVYFDWCILQLMG